MNNVGAVLPAYVFCCLLVSVVMATETNMADSRGGFSEADTTVPVDGGFSSGRDALFYPDLSQSFAYTSGTFTAATVDSSKDVSSSGVLTRSTIHSGLSRLGSTADGTKIVFLSLSLPAANLKDTTLLTSYSHIQYLDLSHNTLKDLSVLSCLSNLISLNVAHNKLTSLLDFTPPHNLIYVDYSYNEIEEISNLCGFDSISSLNLSGNQITELTGLSHLHCLTALSVSENRIERIQGLDNLPLNDLNLSGNSITAITNLDQLHLLKVVNLAGNQIHSLKGLSGHRYLKEINMEDNQIVELIELSHLSDLRVLESLNLKRNPIQTLSDYKQAILIQLTSLLTLDGQLLTVEEKVAAKNRHCSPLEVSAGCHHLQLMCKAARKPARLHFSTLTQVDEPYPMLVLCGPPGSAKGSYAQFLVEEFPSFFGLGVSHTTRPQGSRESHGKDYYFINDVTFKRASDAGEFIQVTEIGGYMYGLTMAAIEQVAQQGLACVTHMSLEGVMMLKRSHFDPRYILMMPLTPQIHEQRLKAKSHMIEADIVKALSEVCIYQEFHQTRPGFFDATINTDNLQEGYSMLQSIVMAYGGITPETPLTLSLSASRPATQNTSTTFSTFDILPETGVPTGGTTSGVLPLVPSSTSAPVPILAHPWSRPSSSSSVSQHHIVKKSVSDQVNQCAMVNVGGTDHVTWSSNDNSRLKMHQDRQQWTEGLTVK